MARQMGKLYGSGSDSTLVANQVVNTEDLRNNPPEGYLPPQPGRSNFTVDNDILDVWMHGRQQRRRRRVLGVVAGLLLAAFWGLFRGGAEVDVHEAAVAATAVPEVAPAPVRVSPSVAAILGHDQVVEIPASTAVEEAPPAPMVRTASVVPGPTPKPAVAPAPPVDREVAGLHWYTSAMDAKGAGNAALAEKMMLRAVAKAPTRGDWWAELGTLQRDLGKADDAEVSSRRASYLLVNSAE